ncbi:MULTISPECIES: hypothetical protein [Paenibacillus]|uniref:Uncharacterized protein n=1 Tax=Paenibacillus azoreducens TaxID=116718 RepID=A0A920CU19_9BACL|nr:MULTISPECIES: hypothetical protein [Paenibacillus]GIO49824.1 hypothetical protein J34TS1_45890 [Paenibacillus azoreducens]
MSIDRFILRKLDACMEENTNTRANLLKLFQLRIRKAQEAVKWI